jgi:aldose 1-epimerase
MPRPASGNQIVIGAGPYRAVIASVGASLRKLQYDGRDLIVPFAADRVRPSFRGAVLAPWPGRVVDGRYVLSDSVQRLPLNESAHGHARDGLALWLDFAAASSSASAVSMMQVIEAQEGYPCRLAIEVGYRLDTLTGLTWQVSVINVGSTTAPYGTGVHPYLVAGPSRLDEWELTLPAQSFVETVGDRLLPGEQRPAAGGSLDFLAGRPLGDSKIDNAFSDLVWDGSGHATAVLKDPSGTGVAMAWGRSCPWVHVHTADHLADDDRLGLAVEPVTCPPNAFNSHEDLIWLEPGQTHQATWEIRAL